MTRKNRNNTGPWGIWFIALCCLVYFSACSNEIQMPQTTANPTQTQPELTATLQQVKTYWEPAAKELENARDLAVEITLLQQSTQGEETFSVESKSNAHYLGRGTNALQAQIRERLTVGTYETEQTLWYSDETAFSQVKDSCFYSNLRQKAFLKTQLSLELPNPEYYSSFTLEQGETGATLVFSDGLKPESWLTSERKAVLLEAEASVSLAPDGSWQQYSCRGSYILDQREYLVELTVERSSDTPTVVLPEEKGTKLEDITLPRQILLAAGQICSADGLSATAAERMYCQAADLDRIQTTQVCISGAGESLSAMAEHKVELVDYTNTSRYNTQSEWFSQGSYHYAVNGVSQSVTQTDSEQMRQYCQQLCLRYLLTPQELAGGQITKHADSVTLTLQPTDAFVEGVYDEIYRITKLDLDGYAPEYTDTQGQITVVLYEEQPFRMTVEISLRRSHRIDGIAYETGYQLSQTIHADGEKAEELLVEFLKEKQ